MKIFNKYRFIYILTFAFTMLRCKFSYALPGINILDNCKVPSSVTGDNTENVHCLFCNMFKAIFNAGSLVANNAYNLFSEELGELLLIFICVSLALTVLKNLSSMGGTDTPAIMNEILQKTFIGAVIYLIISGYYYSVVNMTIVPMYEAGLGLFRDADASTCAQASGIKGFSSTFTAGEDSEGGLPISLGEHIVCNIKSLESKITVLFDLGDWAFCRGFSVDLIFGILFNLVCIIDGILFYLCGLVLMVMFPWVLIDALFQLALSFILLPFAICGYAFQGTKKYLPTVFSWILNSLIVFIFMNILILCLESYLQNIIKEALVNSNGNPRVLFLHPVKGIAFYGLGAIKIIFIVYIIYVYIPIVKDLGDKFAAGSGLSAGKGIDTFMRDQINKQGKKLGDKAMQGAKNTLEWGSERAKDVSRNVMMKYADKHGGVYIPFKGRFETKTVSGKKFLEKTKKYKNGNDKEVEASDDFSTIKMMYDKNGNLIGKHVEFKDSFAKNLLDAKGNIDQDALNVLLASPLAQDPEYLQAIMEQVAIDMLEAKGKKVGKYFSDRKVTFDKAKMSITIDQVDHNGRVTKAAMKIDPRTGQVSLGYDSKQVNNKIFAKPGVSVEKESKRQNRRRTRKMDRIRKKLGGAKHANGLFYSYDEYVDSDGIVHYQKKLRSGWNLKNYLRAGKNVLGATLDGSLRVAGAIIDAPLGIVTTTGLAVGSIFSKKARAKLKDKFDNIKSEITDIPLREKHRFSKDWHSGDIDDYSVKGYLKKDSTTGGVDKREAAHAKVTKNKDGSKVRIDINTNTTFDEEGLSGTRDVYFFTAGVETNTRIVMGKDGAILSEDTKFKYADRVQKGHDSVLSRGENKVVNEKGDVAGDIDEDILLGGINEVFAGMYGSSNIGGQSAADYFKNNVLAEGSKRRTNRVHSNLSSYI